MAIPHSLSGLREAVLARSDWPNAPTSGRNRVDRFINQAIDQISLEAPYLFNEGFIRFATLPDVEPASDDDTLEVDALDTYLGSSTPNPYVLVTSLHTNNGATVFKRDRSWDTRYIDITDDDDVIHTCQIRSVWLLEDYGGSGNDHWAVSLARPFPRETYGDGPFAWRIYSPFYYLPDNVIEMKSMRLVGRDQPCKLQVLSQDEAEEVGIVDSTFESGGAPPVYVYRRGHFQMPAPNVAASVANGSTWFGPEPPGTFEYMYTYAWGKRDIDHRNHGIPYPSYKSDEYVEADVDHSTGTAEAYATNRVREPMFESAPSPVSAEATVAAPAGGVRPTAVRLTFPNIEYHMGFLLTGSQQGTAYDRSSTSHSGVFIRIYRRRNTANFTDYASVFGSMAGGGARVSGLDAMDIRDEFYLLTEFKVEPDDGPVFVDTGFYIPDMSRPLRDIHGYQGIRFHPQPDARYEVEARCLLRPEPLVNDQDVPTIHPEATMLVVDFALSLLYEHFKDPTQQAASYGRYKSNLQVLTKRYSDLRPAAQPTSRRPARSRRYARYANPWWRN